MNKLIKRFSDLVKGSIPGFNRIVFKGFIFPLMAAKAKGCDELLPNEWHSQ